MKKRFLITALVFAVMMFMAGTLSVFADVSNNTPYDYTITIYAGQQGHFERDPKFVNDQDHDLPKNSSRSADEKTLTITAELGKKIKIEDIYLKIDNSDYYLRGFRQAGHDNDEKMETLDFKVDQDIAYEAAYGIKGEMVKYTVHYQDEDGDELIASEEFYGRPGDKPVVSFRYVDGYQPDAYNLTKTLSTNEADNVFIFTYSQNGGGGAGGAGAAGAGGAGAGAGAGAGTNIGDANAPQAGPADLVDLDDNQTPTTDGTGVDGTTDIDDNKTPGANWPLIGGGAALLVAIAAAALILARRRREEEEEE